MRLSQIAHATESNPTAASLVDARTIVTLSGLAPATLHAMGVRVATSFSARLFNLLITNAPEPSRRCTLRVPSCWRPTPCRRYCTTRRWPSA